MKISIFDCKELKYFLLRALIFHPDETNIISLIRTPKQHEGCQQNR